MANDKAKVILIGGGAAAALALLFSGGEAKAAEPEEEPEAPPKPAAKAKVMTAKELAVSLAVKFAAAFGVPVSLVLAIIKVQSNWNPKATNLKNKRGGAWGFTQMTLATAADLTKRFPANAKKWWPKFNGTGPSLLDPATNVALGAYQLSLQWKRFRAKPSNWMVTALAYHQGSGGMDKLLKAGGGKLPAKLPANATIMRQRFTIARDSDPVVSKAWAKDKAGGGVGAPVFTTSEDAKQKWNTLNTATTVLDRDISGWFKAAGKPYVAAHNAFVNSWLTWRDAVYSEYKDNARTWKIPDLAWNVWDRGDAKLKELQTWRSQFVTHSGKKATGPDVEPEEAGKKKEDWGPYIKAGLAVAGIGAAAALVSSVKH
jgi:hypothetical protein